MPTVMLLNGFRFFFFSNEKMEPPHIHIAKGDGYAKYWIEPEVLLAENIRFKSHELNQIRGMVVNNLAKLREAWHGYFG